MTTERNPSWRGDAGRILLAAASWGGILGALVGVVGAGLRLAPQGYIRTGLYRLWLWEASGHWGVMMLALAGAALAATILWGGLWWVTRTVSRWLKIDPRTPWGCGMLLLLGLVGWWIWWDARAFIGDILAITWAAGALEILPGVLESPQRHRPLDGWLGGCRPGDRLTLAADRPSATPATLVRSRNPAPRRVLDRGRDRRLRRAGGLRAAIGAAAPCPRSAQRGVDHHRYAAGRPSRLLRLPAQHLTAHGRAGERRDSFRVRTCRVELGPRPAWARRSPGFSHPNTARRSSVGRCAGLRSRWPRPCATQATIPTQSSRTISSTARTSSIKVLPRLTNPQSSRTTSLRANASPGPRWTGWLMRHPRALLPVGSLLRSAFYLSRPRGLPV
jgi:hypothetical protein